MSIYSYNVSLSCKKKGILILVLQSLFYSKAQLSFIRLQQHNHIMIYDVKPKLFGSGLGRGGGIAYRIGTPTAMVLSDTTFLPARWKGATFSFLELRTGRLASLWTILYSWWGMDNSRVVALHY
jgi:hypothetical protein